jgi:type II restriction/modification system DNA methylase subunit YeeA
MDISTLERFAQSSRRRLIEQVSTKLQLVISEGSAARRENPDAIRNLEKQIAKQGEQQVIEKNAYIWFNRLCALRFMDANGYTRIAVVSPAPDKSQPEILVEAKSGYFDDSLTPKDTQNEVISFINRSSPSNDPESEAYRLLIVAACNYYHKAMPYLFTRISDFTELLMPDNLLLRGSVMRNALEVMTDESCKEVEIIGWLYQYYISEKKDEVFADLKKNKKITPENIPAATQLFTPHWIVRYLTENSLGRLWLLNNPESKLIEQMDYYIKPEKNEEDYLHISSPEELKICDPACGSGHMLTYAFDLLYAIYDEKGYDPSEIPEKILTHNLFGIEIDERARELSAFALTMKARGKQRRFFQKQIQPNICALKNIHFDEDEREEYTKFIGRDLFTDVFIDTLSQFEETDNFGSLIQPKLKDAHEILEVLKNKDLSGKLFLSATHEKVLQVLKQTDYLSPKYNVVVANPPYMGKVSMNQGLAAYAKENYPDSKFDLFAMFMERTLKLTVKAGFMGTINQQSWMFLSSYEKLRKKVINHHKIDTMLHLGPRAFDSISGEVVQVTAFTLIKSSLSRKSGIYSRLINFKSSSAKEQEFFNEQNRYKAKQEDFGKIPGSPVLYWTSKSFVKIFDNEKIDNHATLFQGIITGNNERFLRAWQELSFKSLTLNAKNIESINYEENYWVPYNKDGERRQWYGNHDIVVNFKNKGVDFTRGKHQFYKYFFKACFSWTHIKSNAIYSRYYPEGFIWDSGGSSAFPEDEEDIYYFLALISSKVGNIVLQNINPTINLQVENIAALPVIYPTIAVKPVLIEIVKKNINISKEEWDSREVSWNFTQNELIKHKSDTQIETAYTNYCNYWKKHHNTLHQNEEELNRLFIDNYELQDELTPEVDLKAITTLKNEAKIVDDELVFQADEIMKQFISYAVGCMFGRYSLDQPGLILANQGESIDQYLDQVPNPSFMPDDDNVIPLLDGNWFTDDIVDRFYNFVRTTFGRDHYDQNIDFIKQSIGKDIRNYFLKDFYSDHIKRYNKRPIYWMLSTPNASFNVLIYMHRYQTDTLSIILNDYLRSYKAKLAESKKQKEAISISPGSNEREKIKALSEIEDISKILRELDTYEHEVIYPLANDQVEIDLDDGVKVNYNKFGEALKKVSGLSGK